MRKLLMCLNFLLVNADIYLHNPRGSNNRLNEDRRARKNPKRLFDSQNNQRGGYNVGEGHLTYYAESQLDLEWTMQHSCNDPNAHCDVVIQYMCNDNLRDGTTTSTIPLDSDNQIKYGLHENSAYYNECIGTKRNVHLFNADQKLRKQSCVSTRQNPTGTRYGLECPEERDYFPYWRASPWITSAVLLHDPRRCEEVLSQIQARRYYCVLPQNDNSLAPISSEECEQKNGKWSIHPLEQENIKAKCLQSPFTRDNYLGNSKNGFPPYYNWTLPSVSKDEKCVLRIRYNLSSTDKEVLEKFQSEELQNRGFTFTNNPQASIFKDMPDFKLQINFNTNQVGRVFQDRSHVFNIKPKPKEFKDGEIYNINVRGKRGNIVQVYPAVEYDFVPNRFLIGKGDFVHVQWTGSDTNPRNNDGQGEAQTDRSNFLQMRNIPFTNAISSNGQLSVSFPEYLNNSDLLGFSADLVKQLAGSASEANFNLGAQKVTQSGEYAIISTRNNNFSNRSQKSKLIVVPHSVKKFTLGVDGGLVQINGIVIAVEPFTTSGVEFVVENSNKPSTYDWADQLVAMISLGIESENSNEVTAKLQSTKFESSFFYNVICYQRFNEYNTVVLPKDQNTCTFYLRGSEIYVVSVLNVSYFTSLCISLYFLINLVIGSIILRYFVQRNK